MKKFFCKMLEKFDERDTKLPVRLFLLAILVNLVIEVLNRHSLIKGLAFVLTSPLQFLYGAIVILLTMLIAFLLKKRVFMITFISGVWIIFGIVNSILKVFRHTPFTAQDLRLIKYAWNVAPLYLSVFKIILIIVGLLAFIAGMVIWFINSPKQQEKVNRVKALVHILSMWLLVWFLTKVGITFSILAVNFGNIGNAYEQYGFVYCFSSSLLNSGIEKPKDYNETTINSILERIEGLENSNAQTKEKDDNGRFEEESTEDNSIEKNDETGSVEDDTTNENNDENELNVNGQVTDNLPNEKLPNIIFLQLESLFNPEVMEGFKSSREILHNINKLSGQYPSGLLFVPSVGAGTANTEFEVLSGMNLNDFGPGEYPYKTVLTHTACESICFDLKNYGYKTNAIHNNEGTFYDRNSVFSQLGFDTFTSIEYMNGVKRNPIGWPKDEILIGEIIDVLSRNEERSFIYTISVQGHGDYPEEYQIRDDDITVSGDVISEFEIPFTYYVNQIREMDMFVGELVISLLQLDEPVVLVMYGDHLPAFDITDDELTYGDTFSTPFVIWNNLGIVKSDEDIKLEAFQFSSYVFDMLGISGGAISKYHSAMRDEKNYDEYLYNLKILEYDILYGEKEVYGGKLPYSQTNLLMGHKNILINSVSQVENLAVIVGENFTEYSKVVINGEDYDAEFVNENMLYVRDYNLKDMDALAVVQKGRDGIKLSSTSFYIFRNNGNSISKALD